MFRHCDLERRLETQHSNLQIDKSRSHLNLSFGLFSHGYEAMCSGYDSVLQDLDSKPGANRRKDRVTLVGWSIPVPEGMSEAKAVSWVKSVYKHLEKQYGEVLLGGSAHFDEVHEYIDSASGEARKSRVHLHAYAVPVIDGKLNAKQFMSRANMIRMNDELERLTAEEFPGYKFMNGTKRKSKRSVEELKNDSAVKEVQQKLMYDFSILRERAAREHQKLQKNLEMQAEIRRKEVDSYLERAKTCLEDAEAYREAQASISDYSLESSDSKKLSDALAFLNRYKKGEHTLLEVFEKGRQEKLRKLEEQRRKAQAAQWKARQMIDDLERNMGSQGYGDFSL